jgi:hypothetical protein
MHIFYKFNICHFLLHIEMLLGFLYLNIKHRMSEKLIFKTIELFICYFINKTAIKCLKIIIQLIKKRSG